ncbi:unnamed protein product [Orchesella dallaii]|uniref:Major facilitator superfamily associated domain-containing protein n=1 Tax=Orchesella dallaii TaxID=48710 RepID=A0ABP1PQK1_9HEXA
MGLPKLNIKYLPIKLHYFLYWGGTASIWPFIPVFAKQMGLSEMAVGLIFTVAPMAGLIAKPFFGAMADRFKRKKKLFLFFILLNLMSYLCVAFLPQNKLERPVELECNNGVSYITQCERLSPHCEETILDSFKPVEVRERHKKLQDGYNRSERAIIENDEYLEVCTGTCEFQNFREGVDFCTKVQNRNVPPLCYPVIGLSQQLETPRSDSIKYAPAERQVPSNSPNKSNLLQQEDELAEHDNTEHLFEFKVKLKIDEVLLLNGCLYLPIGDIDFEQGYRGLSCFEKTMLRKCEIDCGNNTNLNRHLETIKSEEELLDSMNFWLYGSLVVIAWIAMGVTESLSDALCFQTLGDQSQLYGKQRLWGTVGWGTFSFISGYFIDTYSEGKLLKDYTPCFYLTAGLLTLDICIAYKWDIREVEKPKSLRRDVCGLLSNLRIDVFIVACVIVGMCTGLLWQFLFWYVETLAEKHSSSCDHRNWVKLLEGLIQAVQCFGGELPFFFLSGWIIKKLGHVHCMTLVLGAFGVRFIIYSFITNPWTILPVELFQGLTYGIFYANMVSYANQVSPPGTAATVQGIVQAAFVGIGVAVGSLVGGLIFQGANAFRVFGVGCLIFCVLHALAMAILGRHASYPFPQGRGEAEGQEMCRMSTNSVQEDYVNTPEESEPDAT